MADYYYVKVTTYVDNTDQNTFNTTSGRTFPPTSSTTITTYNTYAVWYGVQVYITQNSNLTGGVLAGNVSSVTAALPSGTSSQIKLGKVGTYTYNGGDFYAFSVERISSSGSVTAKPNITVKLTTAQATLGNSDTISASLNSSNIKWPSGSQPTIQFTATKVGPPYPVDVIGVAISTGGYSQPIVHQWVDCKQQWYVKAKNPSTNAISLWSFDVLGNNGIKILSAAASTKKAINTKAIDAVYLKATNGTICDSIDGSSNNLTSTPTEPSGVERYNPPPHSAARSISYAKRKSIPYKDANVEALLKKLENTEKIRLVQEVNGAAALNTNKAAYGDSSKGSKLWGFRAMYNPNAIQYTTSSNNQVDWTLGSKDPARLLAGNQSVSMELYINRIPDMSYLLESTLTNNSDKEFYGRRLSKEEREGLLYRGTEYDIEFLYRVLNGDPIAGTFLLDQTNYKGVTSDFGYTTATPCWLHLNNNMRYFGSVASLSVSHALFTENMVPMLSIVQISFSRYPALWNVNSENTLASLKDQVKTNASGSSTTADTTGTGKTP